MKNPSMKPLVYFLLGFTIIAAIAVKIADYCNPEPRLCNARLAFTDKPVKMRHCEIHAGPEIVVEIEKERENSSAEESKDPDVADFDQMA